MKSANNLDLRTIEGNTFFCHRSYALELARPDFLIKTAYFVSFVLAPAHRVKTQHIKITSKVLCYAT